MINIAWTALLHAIFDDRHRRPWYRRSGTGKRVLYVKVDGDPKHWELRECLKQYFGTKNPPERKNLEFWSGCGIRLSIGICPNSRNSVWRVSGSFTESGGVTFR